METASELVEKLLVRLEKYASVLRAAEEEGNASKVRRYKRIIAEYEKCIKNARAGKPVALGELPNPPGFPPLVPTLDVPDLNVGDDETPNPSLTPSPMPSPIAERKSEPQPMVVVEESPSESVNVLDLLNVRLEKYQSVLKSAEDEGVAAKVRRYKRIIAQYSDAIRSVEAGKEVDLSELPNPPGLPPLVPPTTPQPSPQPSPLPSRAHSPTTTLETNTLHPTRPAPAVPSPPSRVFSRADKQTATLRERQKEYREAAITAKRAGQIPEAKEFLKICKGFDRLIQASESGLPVDLSTIPVSLHAAQQAEETFHVVSETDFVENADTDVYEMLKNELQEQIKSCMTRRTHLKNMGDVANANRFEQWALTFKKDLNKVAMYQSSGQPIPKFRYEQKSFPVVHCFSDVAAGELELSIVQAVSLSKPCDTYVGYEFPYPSDSPPSGYTSVIKNSVNPVYDTIVKFPIDRDAKPCQRVFKRHGIKLEVWVRGGFLRRDVSLGTVVVKLLPLTTTDIMIHDAFDLMNGRRPAGGKLEVKIRVREPILAKKMDTITEKWLILD